MAVLAGAVGATALHLLGVGGYRTGFLGVFVPLAALTGVAAWLGLAGRSDRVLWTVALVVVAASVAGVLTTAAPPSRGVLLADARSLLPEFYEEVSHDSSGHSWCRPDCPAVTVVARPPATGDRAVMIEIGSQLFQRGLLTEQELSSIQRQRTFEVPGTEVRYRVSLRGEGDARRLHLGLTAR